MENELLNEVSDLVHRYITVDRKARRQGFVTFFRNKRPFDYEIEYAFMALVEILNKKLYKEPEMNVLVNDEIILPKEIEEKVEQPLKKQRGRPKKYDRGTERQSTTGNS